MHVFIGEEKLNIEFRDPHDIFSTLFDEELLNKIVVWLNSRTTGKQTPTGGNQFTCKK